MKEIPLKSGATLKVQLASFSVGMKLKSILARELKQIDIPKDVTSLSFTDISKIDVNILKDLVFQLLGSDALEMVLWELFKPCLYESENSYKIDKDFFEDEKRRGEYFPIAWEVIKENALPFFRNLPFELKAQPESKGSSQR